MSTSAATGLALAPARAAAQDGRVWPRVVAFAGLATFASLHYATLLLDPPDGRVLAAVAIAVVAGAGLALSDRLTVPASVAAAARILVVAAALVLSLLAIGVPAHALAPAGWGALGRGLDHGLSGLAGWLWPYRGGSAWARVTVLSVLPVALLASACLCFWPARRGAELRRTLALALLVAIFLAGVVNAEGHAWRLDGILLVILFAAWLWLPSTRAHDAVRAGAWLLVAGVAGLAVTAALGGGAPWIDYRGFDPVAVGATTTFQWDQLYGPRSWPHSAATMVQVEEARPELLRVSSLDRFDGLRFLRSDSPPGATRFDLGRARGRARWYVRATVAVSALRSPMLVGGGGVPLATRWLGGGPATIVRRPDGTTFASPTPRGDAVYTITSYDPTPTAAALRSAPRGYPRSYLPYAQFELPGVDASALQEPDLGREAEGVQRAGLVGPRAPGLGPGADPGVARRIEASPYGPMYALANRIAAGAPSTYDVVRRVQEYLLQNYSYDENVPQARYPLEAFLFQEHRGYCEQFSGAMTLMLRMEGIAARVGVGFQPAVYDPVAGSWRVRALDAHAWVEVFFQGYGWVSFDPTPPAPASGAPGASPTLLSKAALLSSRPRTAVAGRSSAAGAGSVASHAGTGTAALALLLAAALAVLAFGLLALWLTGRRRLRRSLAGDGGEATAELRWALTRLGHYGQPALTLVQLERSVRDGHAEAAGYVQGLRELRYGRSCTRPLGARGRQQLRRALGEGGGPLLRLRALLALPPGAMRRRAARGS